MSTILVAGGTGLLGSALVTALRSERHQVAVLTRRPTEPGHLAWAPDRDDGAWRSALAAADAVVNLAGSSLAAGRWTAARKREIRESRTQPTRALVRAMAATSRPPLFLSSSAIGIYGPRMDSATEDTAAASDFLAAVCREWEEIAKEASAFSRVVLLRTGLVLARAGGVLPRLALPFKLFAGGPIGSGDQYVSWIHLHDWVALVMWALADGGMSGALNLTAPNPVTNAEFARTLGAVLGRPAWLRAPAVALRLVFGEMADTLILGGQPVLPQAALKRGFVFRYATLEPALRNIYAVSG